jgi:RND family efflux transporter MFP subunit
MKTVKTFSLFVTIAFVLFSCGQNSRTDNNLSAKQAKLEKLRNEYNSTGEAIKKLEQEIATLDTNQSVLSKAKLVALTTVQQGAFNHYIELQGKIEAENTSYIAPRGMGGVVKAIYVKQGQQVKKGQLLLKLDDVVLQQQVKAAKQQLSTITTQLNYARDIYTRQKNLWDKGIGTEVQLIGARTNVETLENQLKSAQEQVKLAQEQANTTLVYSDVTGVADLINVRVGETFVGVSAAGPQIRIVNTSSLKAVAAVPENYVSGVKNGAPVLIEITDQQKTIESVISMVSPLVNANSLGFIAEAKIGNDPLLKANQTIVMRILDYEATDALIIPLNLIQSDDNGKYVFTAQNNGGVLKVKKKAVKIGKAYGANIEILEGLSKGEQLVSQGYQNLYDGQLIKTTTNE